MQNIDLPKDKILDFCRRNHIRRLSLFGSVLRPDFRPDSDVDFLVQTQQTLFDFGRDFAFPENARKFF